MDVSIASWLVIAAALAGANLPFFTEAIFGLIPLKRSKTFWMRLLELFALYLAIGSAARLLEGQIGTVFVQTWEFFAISACLFVVFAFPGFVWRYLRKRHG